MNEGDVLWQSSFFPKIPKLFFNQDRHMSHSCGIMDKNTIGGSSMDDITHKNKSRMLGIFFRMIKGEDLSSSHLSKEYGVSTKTITRDINFIKTFLSSNSELSDYIQIEYDNSAKCYHSQVKNTLSSKELMAIVEILIGCRAFSKDEISSIIKGLQRMISYKDKILLKDIIAKEMNYYNPVYSDCESVIDNLWKLIHCIYKQQEITIDYYKMSREYVTRRLRPIAITFSDFYFYLIAYKCDEEGCEPRYFRVDRIKNIIEHRTTFRLDSEHQFDEGKLKSRIQLMFPGKLRTIRFEFDGYSLQAILDKIPTARVIGKNGKAFIIEAQVFGTGINMFLLSQGKMVKAIYPEDFVNEMKEEIRKMYELYE